MDNLEKIQLKVSAFEVYHDKVYDLIDNRNLVTYRKLNEGISFKNLTTRNIDGLQCFNDCLHTVLENRSTGETPYNQNSSRSHIFLEFTADLTYNTFLGTGK